MRARLAFTPAMMLVTAWAMTGEMWHRTMAGHSDPALLLVVSAAAFIFGCGAFVALLEALRG